VLNARHRCPKGQPAEAVAKPCFARVYRAGRRDLIKERGTQLKFAACRAARGEDLLTPSSSPYYTHVIVDWVALSESPYPTAAGQNQKSVTPDSLPESGHSHHLVGSQASE